MDEKVMTKKGVKIGRNFVLNYEWPFPNLNQEQKWWRLKSRATLFIVGMSSKFFLNYFSKTKILNKERLSQAVFQRPPGVPLITVSNHESCIDDPGFLALMLSPRELRDEYHMRWNLAAHDICFTRPSHAKFFSLGKCVPVVRGMGVYQRAVDFIIERLNRDGDWVHIFPEGQINMTAPNTLLRLKWGVGRIISECHKTPIVLPFWHTGMSDVLPNHKPYYLRVGKRVFFNIGEPLQLAPVLNSVAHLKAIEKRKIITDFIQEKLDELRIETLALKKQHQW